MNKNEFIIRSFSGLSEGESESGSPDGRCYRALVGGECPSQCHLNVIKEGGALKYNCFGAKCGISGIAKKEGRFDVGSREIKHRHEQQTCTEHNQTFPLPTSFTRSLTPAHIEWLANNGITERDIVIYDIGHEASTGRIIFPVRVNGQVVGFLSRSINPNDPLKWVNKIPKGTCYASISQETIQGNKPPSSTGVIVEAPTSAIVLGRTRPTLSLLTSNIARKHPHQISFIRKWAREWKIQSICVWLDGDAFAKSKKVREVLTRQICPAKIIHTEKKPRYYTDSEIEEILNND